MSALVVQIQQFLYSGDPLIRSWFLVNNDYAPFALCAAYLLLVTRILPALMTHRKPLQLRNLMVAYNLFLVLAYIVILYYGLYTAATTDCFSNLCKNIPIKRGHCAYTGASLIWAFYLLKYIEMTDTILFVLRKKDHLISGLHLVHHAALPLLTFVLMRSEKNGFYTPCIWINTTVHVIMYTYYGLAALGPHLQKYLWWKKHLTLLQITSFVLMLAYMMLLGPLLGCPFSPYRLAMVTSFVSLIFWFFTNYYGNTYAEPTAAEKKAI